MVSFRYRYASENIRGSKLILITHEINQHSGWCNQLYSTAEFLISNVWLPPSSRFHLTTSARITAGYMIISIENGTVVCFLNWFQLH